MANAPKKCSACKILKGVQRFYRDKYRHDGLSNVCIPCKKEKQKRYKKAFNRNSERKRKKWRLTVLNHYGKKCKCCNEKNLEFLCIDHINGGGNKHKKSLKIRGRSFYRWLIRNNFPKGYRTLCHNCNMAIGFYGYCPHKKKGGRPLS
jgi:hypothetical protein